MWVWVFVCLFDELVTATKAARMDPDTPAAPGVQEKWQLKMWWMETFNMVTSLASGYSINQKSSLAEFLFSEFIKLLRPRFHSCLALAL